MVRIHFKTSDFLAAFYGLISRIESKRADELMATDLHENTDARNSLRDELLKAGIAARAATTIALDVGAGIIIDDDYLRSLQINSKVLQNRVYRDVVRFRMGSLG